MKTSDELLKLQENNMLAILPCKISDIVYTIEYNSSDCANCPNKKEIDERYGICAKKINHNSKLICTHRLYIKQRECEDFEIRFNNDKPYVVAGEYDSHYESSGFEAFFGIDRAQYFILETAQKALFKQAEIMGISVNQGD